MHSLLIEGPLVLEALQENSQSDFDLLWAVLQSSDVQGYISQSELNTLFVEIARTQGIDVASSMTHHLSQVLMVYSPDETPKFDFRISTQSDLFIESVETLPMLSVSAYLERLTLDLIYRDQLANSKNHKILTKWMRKYSEVGVDPLLAIPLALTFLMQGLGLFDKLLGLDSESGNPGDRLLPFPSVKFFADHPEISPRPTETSLSETEGSGFKETDQGNLNVDPLPSDRNSVVSNAQSSSPDPLETLSGIFSQKISLIGPYFNLAQGFARSSNNPVQIHSPLNEFSVSTSITENKEIEKLIGSRHPVQKPEKQQPNQQTEQRADLDTPPILIAVPLKETSQPDGNGRIISDTKAPELTTPLSEQISTVTQLFLTETESTISVNSEASMAKRKPPNESKLKENLGNYDLLNPTSGQLLILDQSFEIREQTPMGQDGHQSAQTDTNFLVIPLDDQDFQALEINEAILPTEWGKQTWLVLGIQDTQSLKTREPISTNPLHQNPALNLETLSLEIEQYILGIHQNQ
jgi:hypothetical protein